MGSTSHRHPLLTPLLLGWLAGTTLQLNQESLWPLAWYGCCGALALAAGLLLALKPLAFWWRTGLALLAAASLAFALCGLRAERFASQALPATLEGRDVLVTGMVTALPQRNAAGLRLRFAVESARLLSPAPGEPVAGQGEAVAASALAGVPPLIYLGWYGDAAAGPLPDLRAGQRWQWVVRLKAPHGSRNPHGFDYELWLWEQGLQATGYVRTGRSQQPPRLVAQTWAHPLEQARQSVRDAVFATVADSRTAGVIAALVAGDQAAIERADWDVFRATGVAHLMSISGLHVTLFAWLAGWLVGRLWRRSARLCLAVPAPHAALLGGVLLATAYALFSGWGVPAQRTVCMLATVALLRWRGRQWPWPVVWLLAVAVVLLWDPWALLQAGFWLSFVAVAVLFASDARQPLAAPAVVGSPLANRWPRLAQLAGRAGAPLAALLREQAVVTLALTPLTLLLFGQFSVVGLLANLVAIPWVTLVVTPLAMLGVLWAPLWQLCGGTVQGLAVLLQTLAAWPLATYSVATPALWAGAAGLLGGTLLALRLPWALRLLGVPLLLPVLLWQAPRPGAGQFELLAADVGQGNAVLVRTARHSLLYDTGPRFGPDSDAGHRVLVPLLRALDERLDAVLLSHRDLDHTGGAAAVLAMQPQAVLRSSIEASHPLQALRPAERCLAGQHWQWDGVDFDVLHPLPEDYARAEAGQLKPNALSCVLRIASGGRSALLVGDIEQPQEAQLLGRASAGQLKADVLLVPHHGSKTSSSAAFLDAVAPGLALVQAGYRNRFGHPAPEVLARYGERQLLVADSAHCGAATWRSAEPGQLGCERQQAPRYWQHAMP